MKSKFKKCVFCEGHTKEEETIIFNDTVMCTECYNNETCICEECGERIWKEDTEGGSRTLCIRCYEDLYTYCRGCNALIHNNDAYYYDDDEDTPYCSSCYETEDSKEIKSYNYKPEPIFYGSGLFLGIELEVDRGGESSGNAKEILDIANKDGEKLYIKHDGSIDEGFELVTHPMDLISHQTLMPWRDILNKSIEMGYLSHQTSTCGLHIHCDRKALGKNLFEQEEVIARILYFVEAHWNEMLSFSRRTEAQISRWARRYGLKDTPGQTYMDAKDKRYGRYVCVNLENYSTIEIRIFRGTLRYETLMASIQLVDEICSMALKMNDANFQSMSWNEFVSKISNDKSELINYLKVKRLYINEPVESEDDV